MSEVLLTVEEAAQIVRKLHAELVAVTAERDELIKHRALLVSALEKAIAYPITGNWYEEAIAAIDATKESSKRIQQKEVLNERGTIKS